MFKILVVEDDASTQKLLETILTKAGYETTCADDGVAALELLDHAFTDLILLDIMMPRMDGLEFTRTLRTLHIDTPIIMLTAKDTKPDRLEGFRAGTDDYLSKPVDEEELLLHVSALLRRSGVAHERKLVIGETTLAYDDMSVECKGTRIPLPPREFHLLYKLLSTPNRVFTRRQLMDELWNSENESSERTVDVHVTRLRERFKECEDFTIITVRGLGYKAVRNR